MGKLVKYHKVSLFVVDPPTPHQSSRNNGIAVAHKSVIVT